MRYASVEGEFDLKYVLMALITAACLLAGYGFYRMNENDPIVAMTFTFGILGIILSLFRKK